MKMTRNQIVDNMESERNHSEEKVMQLQMAMKMKEEQVLSLEHEVKIMDQRLKTKLSEMSH